MTDISAPPPRRAAVSKRLRFEILRRDNHQCRYCGASAPDAPLTVDHVVPVTLGGSNEPSNLVTACKDCNAGKSSASADAALVDDVAADAVRWGRAMERAAKMQRGKRNSDLKFVADFAERIVAIANADPDELNYSIPEISSPAVGGTAGFKRSVIQFRDCGLNLDDLEWALRKAASNRAISDQHNWKYFCGICWAMIRDRQDSARQLLEAEPAQSEARTAAPTLSTIWTQPQVDSYIRTIVSNVKTLGISAEDTPLRCPHRRDSERGHCGDSVCAVAYASELTWYATTRSDETRRDKAVIDEAEALIDG